MSKNPPTHIDPPTAPVAKRRRTAASEQTPAKFYEEVTRRPDVRAILQRLAAALDGKRVW